MNITYLGHSAILLESSSTAVIIDPFLRGNPNCTIDPAQLKVDAVIVTHGHGDHLGDALEIALNNNCPIIAIFEVAMYCAKKGANIRPMNIGGQVTVNDIHIRMTMAWHSSSIEEHGVILEGGTAAGVIVTMGDQSFYHAGDTALFGDLKLIGELYQPDIVALPIGDAFTMGPDEAVIAAQWLGAKHVIPIHYNTFSQISQDGEGFAAKIREKGMSAYVLTIEESIEISKGD